MHKYAVHPMRIFMRRPLPFASGCGRRVEIGGLFGDPAEEPDDFGMVDQRGAISGRARQFGIGKHRLDRPASDRVHGHCRAATLAFGHRVILVHFLAKRTQAQPAGRRRACFAFIVTVEVKVGLCPAAVAFCH